MILGPSWLTFGGAVALSFALGGAGGFFKGLSHEKGKAAVALAKQVDAARQTEANWQTNTEALQEVHDEELRSINASHLRDLAGLRARPASRLPAATACAADGAGATGAQLSQPDAAVVVGIAADADNTASDLRACQAWVKTVTTKGTAS